MSESLLRGVGALLGAKLGVDADLPSEGFKKGEWLKGASPEYRMPEGVRYPGRTLFLEGASAGGLCEWLTWS